MAVNGSAESGKSSIYRRLGELCAEETLAERDERDKDFLAQKDGCDPSEYDKAVFELVLSADKRADRIDGILQHEGVDLRENGSDKRQKQRRKYDQFIWFDVWDEIFKNLVK